MYIYVNYQRDKNKAETASGCTIRGGEMEGTIKYC